LLADLGVAVPLRVWTDSSAAIGICSRQGLGKLRHLDTHTLWIQQAVRSRRIDLRKVAGEENPADLLTKHSLSIERLMKLVDLYDCRYLHGRAESAPLLRRGASAKATMAGAGAEECAALGHTEGASELATPEVDPWMPHLALDAEELARRFPSMIAPDDELGETFNEQQELSDAVYQHGVGLAKRIEEEMAQYGRTRRPAPS
jgi:hypothetical protein